MFSPIAFGGNQIEDQLKFGGLHDGQLARLRPFQESPYIGSDLMIDARKTGAIAHKPASFRKRSALVNGSDPMTRCKQRKPPLAANKKWIGLLNQRIGLQGT
jgi:hypothetical protein